MATKKPEAQVGEELEQLAAAAEKQAADEAGLSTLDEVKVDNTEPTAPTTHSAPPPIKEYPAIVRKQANRLLRLFELPEDHPGRNERIKEYQDALVRNGVEEPPSTLRGTQLFVDEIGEYRG